MFAPRKVERARFEEIENDPELKKELGLSNAASYAEYFEKNYTHVGVATIQNWIKRRKKVAAKRETSVILAGKTKNGDKDFDDFLEMCRKEGDKNSRYADLYAQLKGWKQKPKEEERGGFSPAELIGIGQQVRKALIDEYRNGSGCCPICNFSKTLYDESRLGEGREQPEENALAAVALST